MTNKSIRWRNRPFLLKPSGKDYLWGGSRLNDDFSKEIQMEPLAETWECSTHPAGPSYAANGIFAGKSLAEILKEHPEFLGTHPKTEGELPILIKFIDARQDLSVQVHPDDAYAKEHEGGQRGKTEMWYVLDAAPGTELIYGFRREIKKEALKRAVEKGTVERYLQHVSVQKDDVFYIEAGTVHALGAGALVAEVQESSDLTYRLYDYDRTDKNGRRRELHLDKALAVADRKESVEPRQPLRVLKYRQGCAMELLCRCRYFEVYRMLINTERCRSLVEYQSDGTSFRVLLCVSGCGSVVMEEESFHFFKGDCIFFPAASAKVRIHGKAGLLDVRG